MSNIASPVCGELFTDFTVENATTPQAIRAAQALRYQVFCRERNIFPGADGIEADEFDASSRHVLLRSRNGTLIGAARLVTFQKQRPSQSFPTQLVCHETALSNLPLERTGEISRFSISREWRETGTGNEVLLRLGLMQGIVRASYELGLTHWCASMELSLLRLLRRASIHFESVGPIIEYYGLRQPTSGSIHNIIARVRRERPAIWNYVTMGGRLYDSTESLEAAA